MKSVSETTMTRKEYLQEQMQIALGKKNLGVSFMCVGGFIGGTLLLTLLVAILEVGISGLGPPIELVLATVGFPALFVLGLGIWKHYSHEWRKMYEEWKKY